jgi:hypothetical protein
MPHERGAGTDAVAGGVRDALGEQPRPDVAVAIVAPWRARLEVRPHQPEVERGGPLALPGEVHAGHRKERAGGQHGLGWVRGRRPIPPELVRRAHVRDAGPEAVVDDDGPATREPPRHQVRHGADPAGDLDERRERPNVLADRVARVVRRAVVVHRDECRAAVAEGLKVAPHANAVGLARNDPGVPLERVADGGPGLGAVLHDVEPHVGTIEERRPPLLPVRQAVRPVARHHDADHSRSRSRPTVT